MILNRSLISKDFDLKTQFFKRDIFYSSLSALPFKMFDEDSSFFEPFSDSSTIFILLLFIGDSLLF